MPVKRLLILQDPGISPEKTLMAASRELPGWEIIRGDSSESCSALLTVNSPVDESILKKISGGLVSVAFTGYDHVDMDAASSQSVAVSNVPGYSTHSVAELAFALTINSLRDPRRKHGSELSGKTVGIIGTGSIGIAAASLFKAASCRILGWSRAERPEFSGRYTGLSYLLENSDVVSLHLPLNDDTGMFMNAERFSMMKRGAILINTARAGLVDQTKLLEYLLSGYLEGAGLDVTDPEPLPPDNILHRITGVAITPHIGFNSTEALERRTVEALKNVAAWSRGERRNRVD